MEIKIMKKLILYILVLIVLSSFVSATMYVFQPDGTDGTDAYMSYEGGKNLYNFGITPFKYVGRDASNEIARMLFNWSYVCSNLSDKVGGGDVNFLSANLDLYAQYVVGANSISIFPVNNSWEEGIYNEAVGNSSWTYPQNGSLQWDGTNTGSRNETWNLTLSHTNITAGHINITLNVTYFNKLCNGSIGGNYPGNGFVLINEIGEDTGGDNEMYIHSSDSATTTFRPKLYLDIEAALGSPILYNCSTENTAYAGAYSLNISFYDEETLNVIGSAVNIDSSHIVYIAAEPAATWNYSFGFTGRNNYSLCIYPNSTQFITNSLLDYNLDGYSNRNYYLSNANLTGTAQFLNLYLLSNSNSTAITFYVLEQIGNTPITNAYIKALRYYPATNSYKTVEVQKTDVNGIAKLNLVLNNAFYKFIVEKNNIVLRTFEQNKIYTSPVYLYVSTRMEVFEKYDAVSGVSSTLTWVNSTQTFTWDYSVSSGLTPDACLAVTKMNKGVETTLNLECSSTSAGSLTYVIPGTMTGDYNAYAYVKDSGGVEYLIDVENVHRYLATEIFGTYGLYLYLLFLMTLVLTGIWNPAVAIVMCVFGFGMGIYLGFIDVPYTVVTLFALVGAIIIYRLKT